MNKKKIVKICSIKNCKEKYFAKGFCKYHYHQTSEYKTRVKERHSTPEYKAKSRERYHRPENKAKQKLYRSTPEYKERDKKRDSPERKSKRKEYASRPENKAKQKLYQSTPEFKSRRKERRSTSEQIKKQKEYDAKPETRAKKKEYRDEIRLKVLKYYSKKLSKSNVPCCNCCGENSHILFLAIDHIAGKKQMDTEPELVKLGYSSSLGSGWYLQKWILDNNFPKGFQILCHNCNSAKEYSKNNKCPHQK